MRKASLAKLAFLYLGAFILVFSCRTPPDVVRIKMDYTPTNVVPPPKSLPDTPIFIDSFDDQRKTLDQIGQNSEKAKTIPVKAESAEVISFVEKAFKREFRRVGLNPVESKPKAKRILHVSVLNLWVEEKSVYESSLVAQVTVWGNTGEKRFDKNFRALAQRWGSSYDQTEYRKVLSDTVAELLKIMFSDEAFMKSLS